MNNFARTQKSMAQLAHLEKKNPVFQALKLTRIIVLYNFC